VAFEALAELRSVQPISAAVVKVKQEPGNRVASGTAIANVSRFAPWV